MGIISGRYLDQLERSDWTRNHLDGPEWEYTSERSGYVGGRRGQADMSYEFFS
jgi:hypothetical protein